MTQVGTKSVIPLDCHLGLAGLPFKITPKAMLKIAFWAQNQLSFQRAEEAIDEIMGIKINDDTIRKVSDFVGGVVFKNDCLRAEEAYELLTSGKTKFAKNQKGILYIQADGAALNTRLRDDKGTTWRENKLGEVFSTDNIYFWTDKKGKRQHRINKREYISYVGSVSEFKKHLAACVLRGGYGKFTETVFISDGATWIRNMIEELFPDAQRILDYFHLCENVNTYAKCLFEMKEDKYKSWAKDICGKLRKSKYRQVLSELAPLKDKQLLNCPVNLFGYITNNIDGIDYKTYEQAGYFIGSGAIVRQSLKNL